MGVLNVNRRSGGTRSVNFPVLVSGAFMFITGVLGFSKEGMIVPFLCWLIAAASQRYRVTRLQMGVIGLIAFCIFYYLVPYSQYGRTQRQEGEVLNIDTTIFLLSNMDYVRQQYYESSTSAIEDRVQGYYNTPQGFFDRLEMVSIDDALINHTQQFGTYGISPFSHDHAKHDVLRDLQPAMRLVSTLTAVRELEKGDKVGYNYTFTAPKRMKIGVLPLGYYEGVNRSLSNAGVVKIGGQFAPIVGRVCMNHTIVNLDGIEANVGGEVIVYSNDPRDPNAIVSIAHDHNLFAYTLLTNINRDVRKVLVA